MKKLSAIVGLRTIKTAAAIIIALAIVSRYGASSARDKSAARLVFQLFFISITRDSMAHFSKNNRHGAALAKKCR